MSRGRFLSSLFPATGLLLASLALLPSHSALAEKATGDTIPVNDLRLFSSSSTCQDQGISPVEGRYWQNIHSLTRGWQGAATHKDECSGLNVVRLEPGQSLSLPLPGSQGLQIFSPENLLSKNDLVISLENGSGFTYTPPVSAGSEQHALFLAESGMSPQICTIERPLHLKEAVEVALLVSRSELYPPPSLLREEIELPGKRVGLTGSISDSKKLTLLPALQTTKLAVQGPGILVFEHHILYDGEEQGRQGEYRLAVVLKDGEGKTHSEAIMEYENLPIQGELQRLDGHPRILGRLQRSQIEVPAGSYKLLLRPTRSVAGRLLKEQKDPYLFAMNRPAQPVAEQLRARGIFSTPPAWSVGEPPPETLTSPELLLQTARRLAVDNHHQPGGLSAYDLLWKSGLSRPDWQGFLASSPEMLAPNIFFRNLLQRAKKDSDPPRRLLFVTPQLKGEREDGLVLGSRHQGELFRQLSAASFTTLGRADSAATGAVGHYDLPVRSAASTLRVAALYPVEEQEFEVRTDQGDSWHLRLQPEEKREGRSFRINAGEAAVAMLQRRFPDYDRTTLGGPYALYGEPAPLRRVATIELPLAPSVRTVSIRQIGKSREKAWIALQYRDAKFHQLEEADFLKAIQMAGGPRRLWPLFSSWLSEPLALNPATGSTLESLAVYDLENEYQPLLHQLKSLEEIFQRGVYPPAREEQGDRSVDARKIAESMKAAVAAEKKGQWLTALEYWARAEASPDGQLRVRAVIAHNRLLRKLGEHYLANLTLKGLYLYPRGKNDQLLAEAAAQELASVFAGNGDVDNLLSLYATRFVREKDLTLLPKLAALFLEEGQERQALLVSLLHPEPTGVAETMLTAALRLDWLDLFNGTLAKLDSAEERAYWQALLLLRQGKEVLAESLLLGAGTRGKELLSSRNQAKEIASLFIAGSAEKSDALHLWQQWQAAYPGTSLWSDASSVIKDYAGTGLIFSPSRHIYSQGYRAEPDKPVVLRLFGPTELRLTVRPIHAPGPKTTLTDWIELKDGSRRQLQALTDNPPSESVDLIGSEGEKLGARETLSYRVGPGEHELTLRGQQSSLLVQVERRSPALPSEILPPLTHDTLAAMMEGKGGERGRGGHPFTATVDKLQVVEEQEGKVWTMGEEELQELVYRFPGAGERQALMAVVPVTALKEGPKGREEGMGSCLDQELAENEQCLNQLTWEMEHAPEKTGKLSPLARHAYLGLAEQVWLASLTGREVMKGGWQALPLIEAEEGVRLIPYQGWQPVSPFLRVRKTLLPEVETGEEILHNQNRLVYAMNNLGGELLTIRLRLVEVPYLQPVSLRSEIELDGDKIEEVNLSSPDGSETLEVQVGPGEHRLAFTLKERYTNQFLAIKIMRKGGNDKEVLQGQPELPLEKERLYYLASPTHPVKARILGPALVRIDERREEGTLSDYRYVQEGWQELALFPEKGRSEALFLLYSWQPGEEWEENMLSLNRFPSTELEMMAQVPELKLPAAPAQSITLGQLEVVDKGAWELGSRVVRRRNFEEDAAGDNSEDFLEASLAHRYRWESSQGYLKNLGLLRIREDGGPVLGYQGKMIWYPQQWPLSLRLGTEIYLQNPDSASTSFSSSSSSEYSAIFRLDLARKQDLGLKLYHLPTLSLFTRYLSMDDFGTYSPTAVDQDVFSRYKADHAQGMGLGDTLYLQPWLDTIWFTGLKIGTNEDGDFTNPDHLRFQAGWNQLLGPFQLGLNYRGTSYFSDQDRKQEYTRNSLDFDLTWDYWWCGGDWLELGTTVRQDLGDKSVEVFFSLSYHFNGSVDFPHFAPGEIEFRESRIARRRATMSSRHAEEMP